MTPVALPQHRADFFFKLMLTNFAKSKFNSNLHFCKILKSFDAFHPFYPLYGKPIIFLLYGYKISIFQHS